MTKILFTEIMLELGRGLFLCAVLLKEMIRRRNPVISMEKGKESSWEAVQAMASSPPQQSPLSP